jgi:hypothetical protein
MAFFSSPTDRADILNFVEATPDRMVGEDAQDRADRQHKEPEGALIQGVHADEPNPCIDRQIAKKGT